MSATTDVIQRTWDELGYKVKPVLNKVFVRTDPPPQKIGSIYLPPKEAAFHGGLAHMKMVTATVLSIGGNVTFVKPGDRVLFQRLHFGYIAKLDATEGECYVGFIEQAQIIGHPEDGEISSMP